MESCLGLCDECAEGPYAVVNDEVVQADDTDELFEKIREITLKLTV